ncbi:MAG: hypothetical protein JWN18_713 [Parcubacteria group bacterium]|nr:hypothetical protein [Parcubacteria group bacterium]
MENDAWFFVGVFAFIFIVWIAVGGPLHPLAFTGPTLAQPQELGGGTYLQFPRAAYSIGKSNVTLPGSSNDGSLSTNFGSSIPAQTYGTPFGTPSVYRTLISLSNYVSNASSSNANNEYVQISAAQNAGMLIPVSGWHLVSEATGKSAVIPLGTAAPTVGVVNQLSPISLSPGERAFISSGKSPVGFSFRENKCTGYFSTFQQFTPPLPQICPSPSDELIAHYGQYYIRDASCVDYVNTLPRCQTVQFPPKNISATCKKFVLQYLNYNGCAVTHSADPDFAGNTWHVYLGLAKHLWRNQYEVVKLLDANYKTVDAFSY